jgi:hypothetical protein
MSKPTTALGLAALCAVLPQALSAQSTGGIYTLTRHAIDNGGGYSAGGAFELSYTIGQPDAAPVLSGGGFVLQPGFWGGYAALPTNPANFRIFRDGFED